MIKIQTSPPELTKIRQYKKVKSEMFINDSNLITGDDLFLFFLLQIHQRGP